MSLTRNTHFCSIGTTLRRGREKVKGRSKKRKKNLWNRTGLSGI